MIATVAIIVLAVLLPFVLFDLVARPTIRRLALRNIARRPGEAALVVGGSLLATALITASFIVGDSFGSSIRGLATDRWGPTDELIIVDGPDAVQPAVAAARTLPADLIDGVMGTYFLDVSVGSTGPDRQVAPEVRLLELDPDDGIAFSGDAELFGEGSTGLQPGQVVLNERIAEDLGVSAGQTINVFVGGEPVPLEVAAVKPATGLNGFGEMLAVTGTITSTLDDPGAIANAAVLVSNTGDVFEGAELSDDVVAALEPLLGEQAQIIPVKEDLLLDAEDESAEMTELFGTVGGFSVAAGILLVVNLFVMLAGERKAELGTLRAVGLRGGTLVRAFSMEGALYGIAAAAAGVVVGIGVAAAVMALAGDLFDDSDLTIRLDVVPASLASGAVIGLMVSQVTVLLTSWRITRLNIVRAIRELPEPPVARGSWRGIIIGAIGLAVGVGLYAGAGDNPPVAMLAPVIALMSLVPLLDRFIPRRAVVVVTGTASLIWVAAVFGILPDVMDDPEIYMFLLQGLLLVGLATIIVASLDKLWLAGARIVSGGGIASRLGLAEPLSRPVRSALLVSMYALVIFTVTFMAVMNSVFQAQAPEFAVQAGGSYDLLVDSNPSGGLTAEDLASEPDVAAVAPVLRGRIDGRIDETADGFGNWRATGIDGSFLQADPPPLQDRLDRFGSDAETWAAVAAGDELLMVLDEDFGYEVGETYQFRGADGATTTFTLAGTTQQNWLVGAGVLLADQHLATLLDDNRPKTRFYLSVDDGAEAAIVAERLTNGGVEQGIDGQTFLQAAKAETNEQEGFINILQAYLGLGLLIGIAGLGVVLVRAVRERRRQFGVMRALGIAAPVIRRAFIIEASFVAFQGVMLGIGLGLLSSWQLLTQSTAFEENLSFAIPAPILTALGVSCLVASLLMAAVPAFRAGRVTPAEALRLTT
jgi:putative ABC transport system permease protein